MEIVIIESNESEVFRKKLKELLEMVAKVNIPQVHYSVSHSGNGVLWHSALVIWRK